MKAASAFSIDGALVLILDFDTISAAAQPFGDDSRL
jgi:hypothetical protein